MLLIVIIVCGICEPSTQCTECVCRFSVYFTCLLLFSISLSALHALFLPPAVLMFGTVSCHQVQTSHLLS